MKFIVFQDVTLGDLDSYSKIQSHIYHIRGTFDSHKVWQIDM